MNIPLLRNSRSWFDPKLIAAALSGLLMAGAFPPVGQGWLGFVALVPLLLTAEKRPFASGFVCGLFFFAPLLYWLNIVMTSYGGLAPFFSVVAWLMLCAYLALYFAAPLWLAFRFQHQLKLPLLCSLPILWIAFEYLRGIFLSGFPWGLLGYGAIEMKDLRQIADIFGVYGLSGLFVLVNVTLSYLVQRRSLKLSLAGLGLCALLLVGSLLYARQATLPDGVNRPHLTVGLIQGNIEQQHKWDRKYRQQALDRYQRLSLEAARNGAELLIWPEASAPFYIQEKSADSRQVLQVPAATGSALLFGGPSYAKYADKSYAYYNSAFLLGSDGRQLGRSDKIHLVPFGEYVPFGRVLFFINKLVSGVGDFTSGTVRPLSFNQHDLGVLICYEAIFPELARDYVRHGSDLLINITNDAWFGRSSAPRQLLDMTRMRAIENRIWIARAANTGISALITPDGQVSQETTLFETVSLTGSVELGSRSSLYKKVGDILPLLCLLLGGLATLLYCYLWRKIPQI